MPKDTCPQGAGQPPEIRWIELLLVAASNRNIWQAVERTDLPTLGALYSLGLVEFLNLPEGRLWFVADGDNLHAEPAAGVHTESGGRHWRMTPRGMQWLEVVLERRREAILEQAAEAAARVRHAATSEPAPAEGLGLLYGPVIARLAELRAIVDNPTLTIGEKLVRLHESVPIPDDLTAEQIAAALGVHRGTIIRTRWWRERRDRLAEAAGRRLRRMI